MFRHSEEAVVLTLFVVVTGEPKLVVTTDIYHKFTAHLGSESHDKLIPLRLFLMDGWGANLPRYTWSNLSFPSISSNNAVVQ
jgi:hypothetical protein